MANLSPVVATLAPRSATTRPASRAGSSWSWPATAGPHLPLGHVEHRLSRAGDLVPGDISSLASKASLPSEMTVATLQDNDLLALQAAGVRAASVPTVLPRLALSPLPAGSKSGNTLPLREVEPARARGGAGCLHGPRPGMRTGVRSSARVRPAQPAAHLHTSLPHR